MMRRLPLSFALLAVGIYIVVPTPDEILIHPFMGYMLSKAFNTSFKTGIIWSCTIYVSIGLIFLASSLLLGGRIILHEINSKIYAGTSTIIKGIDERSGSVLRTVGDCAFKNTVEADQILTSYIYDY
ncbi:MAG: hypothetical protein ABIJ47_10745 [Candidatus Bathyarchaeota archaeon]